MPKKKTWVKLKITVLIKFEWDTFCVSCVTFRKSAMHYESD